jgi:hypothetical protein
MNCHPLFLPDEGKKPPPKERKRTPLTRRTAQAYLMADSAPLGQNADPVDQHEYLNAPENAAALNFQQHPAKTFRHHPYSFRCVDGATKINADDAATRSLIEAEYDDAAPQHLGPAPLGTQTVDRRSVIQDATLLQGHYYACDAVDRLGELRLVSSRPLSRGDVVTYKFYLTHDIAVITTPSRWEPCAQGIHGIAHHPVSLDDVELLHQADVASRRLMDQLSSQNIPAEKVIVPLDRRTAFVLAAAGYTDSDHKALQQSQKLYRGWFNFVTFSYDAHYHAADHPCQSVFRKGLDAARMKLLQSNHNHATWPAPLPPQLFQSPWSGIANYNWHNHFLNPFLDQL